MIIANKNNTIAFSQLAKSCFCPGIISLLGNLISSATEQEEDEDEEEWMKEYTKGMGHEIYRTDLSFKVPFGERSTAILFASIALFTMSFLPLLQPENKIIRVFL